MSNLKEWSAVTSPGFTSRIVRTAENGSPVREGSSGGRSYSLTPFQMSPNRNLGIGELPSSSSIWNRATPPSPARFSSPQSANRSISMGYHRREENIGRLFLRIAPPAEKSSVAVPSTDNTEKIGVHNGSPGLGGMRSPSMSSKLNRSSSIPSGTSFEPSSSPSQPIPSFLAESLNRKRSRNEQNPESSTPPSTLSAPIPLPPEDVKANSNKRFRYLNGAGGDETLSNSSLASVPLRNYHNNSDLSSESILEQMNQTEKRFLPNDDSPPPRPVTKRHKSNSTSSIGHPTSLHGPNASTTPAFRKRKVVAPPSPRTSFTIVEEEEVIAAKDKTRRLCTCADCYKEAAGTLQKEKETPKVTPTVVKKVAETPVQTKANDVTVTETTKSEDVPDRYQNHSETEKLAESESDGLFPFAVIDKERHFADKKRKEMRLRKILELSEENVKSASVSQPKVTENVQTTSTLLPPISAVTATSTTTPSSVSFQLPSPILPTSAPLVTSPEERKPLSTEPPSGLTQGQPMFGGMITSTPLPDAKPLGGTASTVPPAQPFAIPKTETTEMKPFVGFSMPATPALAPPATAAGTSTSAQAQPTIGLSTAANAQPSFGFTMPTAQTQSSPSIGFSIPTTQGQPPAFGFSLPTTAATVTSAPATLTPSSSVSAPATQSQPLGGVSTPATTAATQAQSFLGFTTSVSQSQPFGATTTTPSLAQPVASTSAPTTQVPAFTGFSAATTQAAPPLGTTSTPAFTFGSTPTTQAQQPFGSTSAAKPFGMPTTTTPAPALGTSSTPAFTFGTNLMTQPQPFGGTSTPATQGPTFGATATATSTPAFTFGANPTTQAQPYGVTSNPTTQASLFGMPTTATTQAAAPFTGFSTAVTQAQSQPLFGSMTTVPQPFGNSSSTLTPQAQPFGGFSTATTQSQPLFGGMPTSTTQTQPFGGFTTSTTQTQPFGGFSTSTTQATPLFGSMSTSTTPAQPFGGFSSPTTQASGFSGFSTSVTQAQPFGISTPSTQTQPFRGFSSPTTQASGFGGFSTAVTQAQPFGISTPATQAQPFGGFSTPSTQPFGGFSSPGAQTTQPLFGGISTPSTQAQQPFGFSTPATQAAPAQLFGNLTNPVPQFGNSTIPAQPFGSATPVLQFGNTPIPAQPFGSTTPAPQTQAFGFGGMEQGQGQQMFTVGGSNPSPARRTQLRGRRYR